MFERYNDRARFVVMAAEAEARKLGHNWIGTEHLLLGLLAESTGYAADALQLCGVDIERARKEIVELEGGAEDETRGHIPWSPNAKLALSQAADATMRLGSTKTNPGHILLGILGIENATARIVLGSFNVTESTLRKTLTDLMADPGFMVEIGQDTARALLAWDAIVDPDKRAPESVRRPLERVEVKLRLEAA
jgi:ATP-dependent Clp protease ATP-binding subunit ClpC